MVEKSGVEPARHALQVRPLYPRDIPDLVYGGRPASRTLSAFRLYALAGHCITVLPVFRKWSQVRCFTALSKLWAAPPALCGAGFHVVNVANSYRFVKE